MSDDTDPNPSVKLVSITCDDGCDPSADVSSGVYDRGKLTLGQMGWTIVKAERAHVTVVEDQLLPFSLADDDTVKERLTLDPSRIQASDNSAQNLFAQGISGLSTIFPTLLRWSASSGTSRSL